MDWLLTTKFLHVCFAIAWLGGGLIMVFLGARAQRAKDDADLVGIVLKVAYLGLHWYVPAGVLTLIFGALTVWQTGAWGDLWIMLGLAGFVVTFGLGSIVLKPRADKVEKDYKAKGVTPDVVRQSLDILTIAKFDMVLLFTIVADMVLKPQMGDWWLIGAMGVVIVGAGVLFLGRLVRPAAPAAA